MRCEEARVAIRDWLDRNWVPDGEGSMIDIPSEVRRHAEECPDCRMRLDAAEMLVRGGSLGRRAPKGLADRVADSVLEERTRDAQKRERRFLAGVPRWAGLAAAAMVLVVASVLITLGVVRTGESQTSEAVVVHLHLEAPEASRVAVVGDWNDWNPKADVMQDQDDDGVWEIRLKVEPDKEYQYQFLVNGEQWRPDPNAPLQVEDGFGGKNSVLDI